MRAPEVRWPAAAPTPPHKAPSPGSRNRRAKSARRARAKLSSDGGAVL